MKSLRTATLKITAAKIGPMPRPMPAGLLDPSPFAMVTFEDGTHERLFTFYPDEITFTENDLVGLTRDQALQLYHKRNVEYLKS